MAEVGESPIIPPAESRWLRWGMGVADKIKNLGNYHNPKIDGEKPSLHKQLEEPAIEPVNPLAHESAEKPSLIEKRKIVETAYKRLAEIDLAKEWKIDRPDLFCLDYFIPLPVDTVAESRTYSTASIDLDTTPHFSVDKDVSGAKPVINRVTFGRHRILSWLKPFKVNNQMYWEAVAKGEGPTGHASRWEYQEFTEIHPGDPLGLTGKRGDEQDAQISQACQEIGVRSGIVLKINTFNKDEVNKALADIPVVQSTPENSKYIHKPYNLEQEVQKIIQAGDALATEIRVEGGDRIGNAIGLDKEQTDLFVQANAAMLGYEIDDMGIDSFIQLYAVPEDLRSDVEQLAQLTGENAKNIENIASSLVRISTYLHVRNANIIREYNQSYPERQIHPTFKVSDIDWQGRCYDFESSENNARKYVQEDLEQHLESAIQLGTEALDKNYVQTSNTFTEQAKAIMQKYLYLETVDMV